MVTAFAMTMDKVIVVLVFLYILMVGIYAYDKFWMHGSLQETVFTLLLCIALPGVGFAIVWLKDYYSERKTEKDYREIYEGDSFFQDELRVLRPLNKDKELNNVPMEEALAINDYELRRKVVMDTLKEDNTMEYLTVLKEALENEDSETSHYASSIIMLLQEKTQNRIMKKEKEFSLHPENEETGRELEQELYELLVSRLLTEENLKKYYLQYTKISDRLLKEELPGEEIFLHRLVICYQQGDFTDAQNILTRYEKSYPGSEDAVLARIKLCIYTRDGDGLTKFMEELGKRPVVLTQKTLEYIRFFRQGGKK